MKREGWPWRRKFNLAGLTPEDTNYLANYCKKLPKFSSRCYNNTSLDILTKRATMKAASSVVSLVTYSGKKVIHRGSGTIIENNGTILTSAKLIRHPRKKTCVARNIKVTVYLWDGKSYKAKLVVHDFYFKIAVLKIKADTTLLKASLRLVDDFLSVDSSNGSAVELRPDSNLFSLTPGEKVVALGRYFIEPFNLMAAPGEFSMNGCHRDYFRRDYDCKEHFRATCIITSTGEGGPLINSHGEVIGVIFDSSEFTPFIAMNIAFKWWEHYKKYRVPRPPPLLGMELTNLYATDIQDMENVIEKFSVFRGVIVEAVAPGSSADSAGICWNDVIIECCGKPVRSFLELYEMMWEKVGSCAELIVMRGNDDDDVPMRLTISFPVNPR